MTRHDAFVRQVLSNLNTASAFMRRFLMPIAEQLDLTRQSLVPALQKLDNALADRSFVIALNKYLVTSANMENMAKFNEIAVKSYSEETGGATMTLAEAPWQSCLVVAASAQLWKLRHISWCQWAPFNQGPCGCQRATLEVAPHQLVPKGAL
jgi:hypothetical protein